MTIHRRISYILGCSALAVSALALAACSSSPSSSNSPPATTAPASPTAGATANANAAAQITTNWEAFFNPKTSVSQRVNLLQNGSQFQQVIAGQAQSQLASSASAKVTNVTVTSPTQATVKYDILLNGQPQLTNQTGTAVLENGTWKVGVASFCGLLTLENAGSATGLPAACQGA
ncbi:MAG: hypothetical protein J2P27_10660 [Actinobacteria bacterium]|nr:hypothetical protein [Actinomycetota bacterium]